MSFLSPPKPPPPPPLPPAPPPPKDDGETTAEKAKRHGTTKGSKSRKTVLTSPMGDQSQANVAKTTLGA